MQVSVGIAGGSPVGGVDYPRTYQEFRAWFPDDVSCAAYLARLRWPEGFRCPMCGGERAWQTSTQHWKCVACGHKTPVTSGTVFHRTRTPLSTWFAAVWLVTSQKNAASAQNLHDMLGLGSYGTARAWLHKLRRAMVRLDRELLSAGHPARTPSRGVPAQTVERRHASLPRGTRVWTHTPMRTSPGRNPRRDPSPQI